MSSEALHLFWYLPEPFDPYEDMLSAYVFAEYKSDYKIIKIAERKLTEDEINKLTGP